MSGRPIRLLTIMYRNMKTPKKSNELSSLTNLRVNDNGN